MVLRDGGSADDRGFRRVSDPAGETVPAPAVPLVPLFPFVPLAAGILLDMVLGAALGCFCFGFGPVS
jgi:hypothetical protein